MYLHFNASIVCADRVKKLYVFEPCTLQIGDRNFYTLKEDDRVVPLNEWIKEEQRKIQGQSDDDPPVEIAAQSIANPSSSDQIDGDGKAEVHESSSSCGESDAESTTSETNQKVKKRNVVSSKALYKKKAKVRKLKSKREKRKLPKVKALSPGEKYVVETIRTESVADVVWQDGTVEENVPSRELFPIYHLDDQEFFCGDYVCRSEDANPNPHEYGVVEKVDHTGRTCMVRWFKTYTTGNEPRYGTSVKCSSLLVSLYSKWNSSV